MRPTNEAEANKENWLEDTTQDNASEVSLRRGLPASEAEASPGRQELLFRATAGRLNSD